MIDPARRPGLRWVVLAVGMLSQLATSLYIYGLPTVLPALRESEHLSLFAATVVVVAPTAGVLFTLILWGVAADRYGERRVMVAGVASAAALLALASQVGGLVPLSGLLFLAGGAGASVNAASGRLVMGWFSRAERGLAMGIRQTSQPLGIALAGLAMPPLARDHGFAAAIVFCAVVCAVTSVLVLAFAIDPPRPEAEAIRVEEPSRDTTLWRIHLASSMLVVPQFAVSAFTVVYLVSARGWDPVVAGRVVFAFQVAGAVGRIAAGVWSDRVGSRLRPVNQLAICCTILMALVAVGAALHQVWIVGVFGLAAIVTVADNGLSFTAVAELASPFQAGRVLGRHNTVQNIWAVLTPPMLAAVIGEHRYALGFALTAVFPLVAAAVTPVRAERVAKAREAAEASAR